jgi:hypothetical protein
MQSDLQGLEITPGELRRLSGVRVERIWQPLARHRVWAELLKTALVMVLLGASSFTLSLAFPDRLGVVRIVHLVIGVGILIEDLRDFVLSYRSPYLVRLLEEVGRYHNAIAALEIHDRLEAAGNVAMTFEDRSQIISALQLTREDLVRALKTERILREHQRFVDRNVEFFADNLTALSALQVSDLAGERGRLLNETLQIAVRVRSEIKKLQDWHDREQ